MKNKVINSKDFSPKSIQISDSMVLDYTQLKKAVARNLEAAKINWSSKENMKALLDSVNDLFETHLREDYNGFLERSKEVYKYFYSIEIERTKWEKHATKKQIKYFEVPLRLLKNDIEKGKVEKEKPLTIKEINELFGNSKEVTEMLMHIGDYIDASDGADFSNEIEVEIMYKELLKRYKFSDKKKLRKMVEAFLIDE